MQGSTGGFAAYDKDNNKEYLNRIPFADHGAMLDPDCVDVTARCVGYLAQRGYASDHPAMARAIGYIKASRSRTAHGTAAGASIISTGSGRR